MNDTNLYKIIDNDWPETYVEASSFGEAVNLWTEFLRGHGYAEPDEHVEPEAVELASDSRWRNDDVPAVIRAK